MSTTSISEGYNQMSEDMDILEQLQMRARRIKNVRRMENQSAKERLRGLVLFSLETRRLLLADFQYLKVAYKKAGKGLFTRTCSDRTSGNGFKVEEGSLYQTLGRDSSPWWWRHTRTDCPELCMPRPWGCLRSGWMRLGATSSCSCLWQRELRSLPTKNILWFCNSFAPSVVNRESVNASIINCWLKRPISSISNRCPIKVIGQSAYTVCIF